MADDQDWLTIPEAAQHLSVSVPRLRRLIARPEWETRTRTVSRETRTGTRTALCVPVSILEELAQALKESPRVEPSGKQERERDATETRTVHSENGNENAELVQQLRSEVAFLREALQREQSIAMAATTEASALRQRLLSLAPLESPVETPGGVDSRPDAVAAQNEAAVSQSGDNRGGAVGWLRRMLGGGR